MITRRDALRIAAAYSAARTAPFAVSPAEAAALLDQPATCDRGEDRPYVDDADFLDPVQFAEAIDGVDFRSVFENGAAVEMAAYKQALNDLIDRYPELRDPPGHDHPITRLDETALSMWCAAWMGGIRAGAAYEHLRLAMVTPRQVCTRCDAEGRLWGGSPYRLDDNGSNEQTCPDCAGRGTVPTPAPTLAVD